MTAPIRHALSGQELAQVGDLWVFNWLPALYAHDDWLGVWAEVLEPRNRSSRRMVCRASTTLVQQHDLASRYVRSVQGRSWMLLPDDRLEAAATELGVAMLGGWVRNGLQREEVARQRGFMTAQQRANALAYASRLNALPFPRAAWPLPVPEDAALASLGASAMVALLAGWDDGAAERLSMRFPRSRTIPLALDDAQREEAGSLLEGFTRVCATPPGWLDALQRESLQ